jgi:hypothetical protein
MRWALTIIVLFLSANYTFAEPADIRAIGENLSQSLCAGQKTSIKTQRQKNQFEPGAFDTVKTFSCANGRARVLISGVEPHSSPLPMWVVLNRNHPRVPSFLNLGAPVSDLNKELGAPDSKANGQITYLLTESGDEIVIYHHKGKITKLVWTFYPWQA